MHAAHLFRSLILTAGIVFLSGTIAAPAKAQPVNLTMEQRGQIENVVHDYLMNNPQVLKKALARLEQHQVEEQRATTARAAQAVIESVSVKNDVIIGNPNADVTLVAFSDYNCGYCKKAHKDIEALVKADSRVRVVIRDFPIVRPESMHAALVSIAVGQQLSGEKYARFHEDLLLSKELIGKDRALEVAKAAGVNMKQLQNDMQSDTVKQMLASNMQAGQQLSITGTPSFALGDGVVIGAMNVETLQAMVGSVRQCGKLEC